MVTKHSLSDSTQSINFQLEDMRQTFQRFCCHKERFSKWSLANNLVSQKMFSELEEWRWNLPRSHGDRWNAMDLATLSLDLILFSD